MRSRSGLLCNVLFTSLYALSFIHIFPPWEKGCLVSAVNYFARFTSRFSCTQLTFRISSISPSYTNYLVLRALPFAPLASPRHSQADFFQRFCAPLSSSRYLCLFLDSTFIPFARFSRSRCPDGSAGGGREQLVLQQ